MGSVKVPKKHKACIYDNPGTISTKVEEIDTPEPGFGEVLVNLYSSPRPLSLSQPLVLLSLHLVVELAREKGISKLPGLDLALALIPSCLILHE